MARTSGRGINVAGAAVAEAIGTFILVYVGTAVATGAIIGKSTGGSAYDSTAIALSYGIALVAVVAAFGQISGAHVNPAVTLALASSRNFPWSYVPVYLAAQLLGATGAGLATWLTFGSAARDEANVGATYPAAGVGDARAFAVEVLITFILVIVVMAVATDQRVPSTSTAALAVGFALAVGVFIGGPITGGALNPARALGPMIVAGKFTGAWIYLIAPLVGALAAAFLYRGLLARAEKPGTPTEAAEVAQSDPGSEPGR